MARRRSIFGNLSKLLKPPRKSSKSLFAGAWAINLRTGRLRKSKGFD